VRETRELDRRINQPEAPAELQTVGPGSLSSFGCNLAAQSSSHSTFKHRLTHQQGDPESRALKSGGVVGAIVTRQDNTGPCILRGCIGLHCAAAAAAAAAASHPLPLLQLHS